MHALVNPLYSQMRCARDSSLREPSRVVYLHVAAGCKPQTSALHVLHHLPDKNYRPVMNPTIVRHHDIFQLELQ